MERVHLLHLTYWKQVWKQRRNAMLPLLPSPSRIQSSKFSKAAYPALWTAHNSGQSRHHKSSLFHLFIMHTTQVHYRRSSLTMPHYWSAWENVSLSSMAHTETSRLLL